MSFLVALLGLVNMFRAFFAVQSSHTDSLLLTISVARAMNGVGGGGLGLSMKEDCSSARRV